MRHLTLRGIEKHYGDVVALAGIDLEVDPGESLVILGPSGSGKSTLLRVIAGLVSADTGDVRFDDERQNDLAAHERGVSLVFQHFALYPHLSAQKNITLGLRHGLGLSREEARERAADVARLLDITDLLHRRPSQMSGGQQQRVALARALARRAGIVLLDEPLSGLDAQLKQRLRVEISMLLRSVGTTSLHVTHDQDDAMAMGDRIAVMRDGRVEQHDVPQMIYARPRTTFVASFIGSPPMNLLDSEVVAGEVHGAFEEPHPVGIRNGPLTVGVRPEHLHPGNPEGPAIRGKVLGSQLSQGSWIVELETAQGARVRGSMPIHHHPEPGDVAELRAARENLHYFDRDSGLRLEAEPDTSAAPTRS